MLRFSLAVCSLLTVNSGFAHALQTTESDEGSVEVISVTASKTSQNLTQTADSLSVVSADEIALAAPQHINQVLDAVPGVWISRGNGQEHLTAIRSPVLTGAGSCGAFFVGVDGISVRAPGFCNANQLFDVNYLQAASIDVLRSPASTLYGANAMHGVINVISKDAFLTANNQLGIELGAYDFTRANAQFSRQYDNSAWLSLVNLSKDGGYQEQSGYAQQKVSQIYQYRGQTWNNKTLFEYSNLNQETAGFIRGLKSYKNAELKRSNPNPEAFRDSRSVRMHSSFSRQSENAELTLTPYLRYHNMTFLQHFLPWKSLEQNKHRSIGSQTKYLYESENVTWLSGADIDYSRGSLLETQDNDFSPNIPAGVHYDYAVKALQLAAYTQFTWQYQAFEVRAGLRFERNSYDYNNLTESRSACAPNIAVCRFSRPDDQSVSFNALSPALNIQYTWSDNVLMYAKYSQGFRAPQATELFRLQNNQLVSDIGKESMNAVEIGLRYHNRTTHAHFAIYDMRKKDVIFQDSNRQNVSDASTSHKGYELEISHRFSDDWSVAGHISYGNHKYENNAILSTPIEGNVIDTAPKYLSNLRLNYRVNDKINAQLSWQFTDEYYLNPQNTAKYQGHNIVDANVLIDLNDQVRLSLHAYNIGNRDYAERADFAFGSYRYFVGQPIRLFANLVWSF